MTTAGTGRSLAASVARRWQLIDPLLPDPAALPSAGAAHPIMAAAGGRQAAAGSCSHWAGSAESLDLTWGAALRFELTAQIPGLDIAGSLDLLLRRWREHLDSEPGAAEPDSAAIVTWPSRDVGGVKTLLAHGFAPLAVIAARPTEGGATAAATARSKDFGVAESGVIVRRAGPADIDEVVRIGLDAIRFDAKVSGVTERPGTPDALRREVGGILADPDPWAWVAERSGSALGMLAAERPETARWIAPLAGLAPVAYLLLAGVAAGERGGGIGAAMTAQFHRATEADRVAVTLLHYAQVNPLSAPFWSQQGYRPLWTVWEVTPARAVR